MKSKQNNNEPMSKESQITFLEGVFVGFCIGAVLIILITSW